MIIDPDMRTIEVSEPCSDVDCYSKLKRTFIEDIFFMGFPFPLKQSEDEDGFFYFINGWRFLDEESYNNVNPHIRLGPLVEAPTIPEQYKTYKRIEFSDLVPLDELLQKVPKEIPKKSVHIQSIDGKVMLVVGGIWNNPHYKYDMKRFKKEMKRWEEYNSFYQKMLKKKD